MVRFLIATLLALGLTGLSDAVAQQKDVLKATHGAWEIRCIEGTEACAMSQIGKTGKGERALRVTVERLKGAKDENGKIIPAAITVTTPLGILIPYGVRVKIDSDQVIPLPLTRCLAGGCVVQAPMLDEAVKKMKGGSTAKFGFYLNNEVLVDISLRGFTKAYNSLTPIEPRRGS